MRLLITLVCCAMAQHTFAGDGPRLTARAVYAVGATAPLGMPDGVSSIDAYRLTPSFSVGADAAWPLGGRWWVAAGLRLERKAMDANITAEGYRMELRKGTDYIEGVFTGIVGQQSAMVMLGVPVCATFDLTAKWRLRGGAYLSLLLGKDFSGTASGGYLRQGGPTGPRIAIGDTPDTWATYDFGDDMRSVQMGLTLGVDWQAFDRLGFSLGLDVGLTGIFPDSFTTVGQTLYPIYGTVGLFYRLR